MPAAAGTPLDRSGVGRLVCSRMFGGRRPAAGFREKRCMTEEWGAVLVVDDDADMRSLLCDVLQGRGHQCLGWAAERGASAAE